MAQVTALQPYVLPGRTRSFSPKAAGPTYNTVGGIFLNTVDNWTWSVFHFEAYIKAASGTVYARLYNATDETAVADSEVSTASASLVRLRSSAVSLADGKEYVAQLGAVPGDSGDVRSEKIIRIELA